MNEKFLIKSMEKFLDYLKSRIEKDDELDSLYDTHFTVQWMGKVAYIPFGANPVNKLIDILEEELGIGEVI